jgi:hypothetical protein
MPFEFDVKLPALGILKATPSHIVEEIWKDGEDYFEALNKWRSASNENNTGELASELQRYCRSICERTNAASEDVETLKVGGVHASGLASFFAELLGVAGANVIGRGGEIVLQAVKSVISGVVTCLVLRPVFKNLGRRKTHVFASVRGGAQMGYGKRGMQITQTGGVFGPKLDISIVPNEENVGSS